MDPTRQEMYTLWSYSIWVQRSFSTQPNFRVHSWTWAVVGSLAFITICVSLGVRCSAPPPGVTYTNEDTTSNVHPPHSVLNYSAVPLPEPTQHPELQQKPCWNTNAANLLVPESRETEDTCLCPLYCRAMFGGCSSETVNACLCVGKWVFVHYTVSCAIIWY